LCGRTRGWRVIGREVTRDRPLGPTYGVSGLIEFSRHVEVVDRGLTTIDSIEADQWIDLEVSKVEVHIYGVQAEEEVD
jgi:hypothetical protein